MSLNTSALWSNSAVKSKPDKYRFPASDPPPLQGLLEYTPKQLYLYILNLIYHRLTPENYNLWCELTERDVSFPEMSKNGTLETSYSLKNQRDHYKKSKRKTTNVTESNLLMSNIQDQKVIPPEILTKLQDNQTYLALYLLQREEFITLLNDLVALNYSSAFTKLVKRMLRLASDKQNANCKIMNSMHKFF